MCNYMTYQKANLEALNNHKYCKRPTHNFWIYYPSKLNNNIEYAIQLVISNIKQDYITLTKEDVEATDWIIK